jgi:hypothetical protein
MSSGTERIQHISQLQERREWNNIFTGLKSHLDPKNIFLKIKDKKCLYSGIKRVKEIISS